MKTLVTVLIAVSVALNVALLGTALAGRISSPAEASPPPAAVRPASPKAAPLVHAETWANLQPGDLRSLAQRLRDGGFPPDVVRAIVAAQLRESYAARLKAIDPGAENRPFWKSYSFDPKVRAAQNQLHREQQKILRELFGAGADPNDSVNALYQGRRLDSVPAEKLDDVRRLLREFEDARQDIFNSFAGGVFGPEMQKRLNALDADHRESLARILTPQEFEDYQVRNSDSARNLRNELSAFNPTEAEFRAIHRLQFAFDQEFGGVMYSQPSPEDSRRRAEKHQQLREQIKATLGPTRAADYERASDYSYRQTSQLVARLELPPETTQQVYAIKSDLEGRMRDALRSNAGIDREQALAQYAEEARTRITAVLGARGYEAYQQYGGTWLRSMQPRPAPPRP